MPSFVRSYPGLSAFSASYLAAAAVAVVVKRNGEFAFYLVSLLVVIAIVLALHRRVSFSRGVLWALSIWGLVHMIGGLVASPAGWPYDGDVAVMYSVWIVPEIIKYDHVVHAFGFGTCVFVCHQSLVSAIGSAGSNSKDREKPSLGWGPIVLCWLAACGLGATNEILEFIATQISPETNVGGYVNTSLDLVSNLFGATVAMLVIGLWPAKPTADH